eukprot:4118916-Prymnesium_polylepis.1
MSGCPAAGAVQWQAESRAAQQMAGDGGVRTSSSAARSAEPSPKQLLTRHQVRSHSHTSAMQFSRPKQAHASTHTHISL